VGGAGDDIYVVDSASDQVSESVNAGADRVDASVSYTLPANVESLTLTGTTAISGTGNELANTLIGNTAANILTGGAGADGLTGGDGLDTLVGGAGDDSLAGGAGDDTYRFSRGDGLDLIADESGGGDRLRFGSTVGKEDLWLWRQDDDLRLGIRGTADRLTVDGWYSSPAGRLERFETESGPYALAESQVQQLVAAMAVFDAAGQGHLDVLPAMVEAVLPVIAAAWQPSGGA